MNIVGLGNCGCNIAEEFYNSEGGTYLVFQFDSEGDGRADAHLVPLQCSHKEYETNFSCPDFKLENIHNETIFICSSSGTISGCALKLLEHFKDTQIRIVLIISEEEHSSEQYYLQHKLIFNSLQDYARSGVFKDIVLISNESLEGSIPDLTFTNRFKKINQAIHYILHMLNIFENTKPVAQTKLDHKEHSRIMSLGTYDYKKDEEKMYFSLDNVTESMYYVSISKEKLETDTELINIMKNNFKNKKNAAYQIFSNQHDQDYGFVVKKTFFHQGQDFS